MKEDLTIKEALIKLENDLADELLRCSKDYREVKYTEVYEKLYSAYSREKRKQKSKNYFNSALAKRSKILKTVGKRKNILDIGSGFGHLSFLLAKEGNKVTGIDINGIHIRESIEMYGHYENINFYKTSGVKLDFPNKSFDFVTSTSVFEHLHPNDVGTHLSEVHRVLRENGKYIFTSLTPHTRGDIASFSQDPAQRRKHGFHINEMTWMELKKRLYRNNFTAKTDIIPDRILNRIKIFSLLVPISLKVWLEENIYITSLIARIFKLGKVFIVAKKSYN